MKQPLMMIGAGGTGGHMFPAQALAEEMLIRGWRVTLTTDARGARYTGRFPDAVAQVVLPSGSFSQGGALGRALVPLRIAAGVLKAIRAMRRDRPALVAGFGGYPALPSMIAAKLLGVPVLIHEQNGVLGRVNRLFAPRVARVACGTWPTPMPKGAKAVYLGNPIRPAIKDTMDVTYALPNDGPLPVLVMGGSQGAAVLSQQVPQALAALPEDLRARLKVTHQARAEDHDRVVKAYATAGIPADVRAFFEDVPQRLAQAVLVISRSGASSVAEIAAVGRPSLLIPYLYAMDDHQTANAKALCDAGAAVMMPQKTLTAEALTGQISAILSDPAKAEAMAMAAKGVSRPHAARDLADLVETLAQTGTT